MVLYLIGASGRPFVRVVPAFRGVLSAYYSTTAVRLSNHDVRPDGATSEVPQPTVNRPTALPSKPLSAWNPEDDGRLLKLCKEHRFNWLRLEDEFPGFDARTISARHVMLVKLQGSQRWSTREDLSLRSALARFGTDRWLAVSEEVGTQDPLECYNRWYTTPASRQQAGLWPLPQDMTLLLCIHDGVPRLLEPAPAYVQLCQQFRRFQPKPFFVPGQFIDSSAIPDHPPGERPKDGALPLTFRSTPNADHEPKRRFWHHVAIQLSDKQSYHPQLCRERWRVLINGARVAAKHPPSTLARFREERKRLGRIDPLQARDMGLAASKDELMDLERAVSLADFFHRMVMTAAEGGYKLPRRRPDPAGVAL
ncbi:hypothetical protein IWQ60_007359 [Tieghemiomyces parasiticus]|uniref:Myb-like domain-containing protein n=1 Tax=Tieghemiomyces parasiticus TaxID=78921 RepID=A0A9W8A7C4_9FUNG|nr:hypothetical protein IWQ60_007359 [Tieghemiomyces parasiticus]